MEKVKEFLVSAVAWVKNYLNTMVLHKVHFLYHTVVDGFNGAVANGIKAFNNQIISFDKIVWGIVIGVFVLDAVFSGKFGFINFVANLFSSAFVVLTAGGPVLIVAVSAIIIAYLYTQKK
jgi:hypothetical protein